MTDGPPGGLVTPVALLLIDMQNDYVHRQGAVLRYFRANGDGLKLGTPDGPSAVELMVPRLINFVSAASKARVPLIWVRTINDRNTESPVAAAQGKKFAWSDDSWGTAFYDGLEPQPGEAIVTKHRHSAFFGTDLELILSRSKVQTLILTGVSTPYCVEATARDAFARDYHVITVSDCTASKIPEEHEQTLARLGRVFGRVETSGCIKALWDE